MLSLKQRLELFDPSGYERSVINVQDGLSEYDHDQALKQEAEDLDIDLHAGEHFLLHSGQLDASEAGARSGSVSSNRSTTTADTSFPPSPDSTRDHRSLQHTKKVDWDETSTPAIRASDRLNFHQPATSASTLHRSSQELAPGPELKRITSTWSTSKPSTPSARRAQSMIFMPSLMKLSSCESVHAPFWSSHKMFRGLSIRRVIPKLRRLSVSSIRLDGTDHRDLGQGESQLVSWPSSFEDPPFANRQIFNISLTCSVCVNNKAPSQFESLHRLPCGHYVCSDHAQQLYATVGTPEGKTLYRRGEIRPGARMISNQVSACCGLLATNDLLQLTAQAPTRRHLSVPSQSCDFTSGVQCDQSMQSAPRKGYESRQSIAKIITVGPHFLTKLDSVIRLPESTVGEQPSVPDERLQRQPDDSDLMTVAKKNLEAALTNPYFRSIRSMHESERDRHLEFQSRSFQRFIDFKSHCLKDLTDSQSRMVDSQLKTHAPTLNQLEESHLRAEEALCQDHEEELRKCRMKTRHQEAYYQDCMDGISGRVLSEEDRKQLSLHRRLVETLPKKHEDAINVLRARQAREYKVKKQAMEDELQQLKEKHCAELRYMEENARLEQYELHNFFKERQKRWNYRWALALEIWRTKQHPDTASVVQYPLAHPEWPELQHPFRL